jgi:hypothetical protein
MTNRYYKKNKLGEVILGSFWGTVWGGVVGGMLGLAGSCVTPTALRVGRKLAEVIAEETREPDYSISTLQRMTDIATHGVAPTTAALSWLGCTLDHAANVTNAINNHEWNRYAIIPLATNALSVGYEIYRLRKKKTLEVTVQGE